MSKNHILGWHILVCFNIIFVNILKKQSLLLLVKIYTGSILWKDMTLFIRIYLMHPLSWVIQCQWISKIYPTKILPLGHKYTRIFNAALFTIAKRWKQCKCRCNHVIVTQWNTMQTLLESSFLKWRISICIDMETSP